MYFAPEFFEGEIRDGFYVQPTMKRVWAGQIEVLNEIDIICRRHGLTYIAWYGTLLGAIRHKGFIPWDDDTDIAMPRADYERFIRYARQELPEDWRVNDYTNGNYTHLLLRVINGSAELTLNEEFLKKNHGCPYIVGMDIFPLDNIPDDETQRTMYTYTRGFLSMVNDDWEELEKEPKEMERRLKELEEATGQQFDRMKPLRQQVAAMADRAAAMYWDEKTENVAVAIDVGITSNSKMMPRHYLDRIIRVPFENTTIPVVEEYEAVLKGEFGDDYMQPAIYPTHDYPFFKDQFKWIRKFFEKKGMELPKNFHLFLKEEGKPLVSVIIPCCNAGGHIDRCLQSLMCQSVAVNNLEIICVDTASTDGTMGRLEVWEKKLNSLLTIVQAEGCSTGEAINIGLQYATSDYVTFMEPDDWAEVDYLERLYRPIESVKFDVAACGYQADDAEELVYFQKRQTGKESRALLIDSEEKQKGFLSLFLLGPEIFGKLIRRQLLEDDQISFQGQLEPAEQKLYFEMQLHMCAKQIYLHEEKLYHRYMKERNEE